MRFFRELEVRIPADVAVARHCAGQMAGALGFSAQRQAEVRLMASELAQNHLDHGTRGGMLRLAGLFFGNTPRMTIVSMDRGPGISSVESVLGHRAEQARSSTGLGAGLASIRRLADRFFICSGATGHFACPRVDGLSCRGTMIVAHCWPDGGEPGFLGARGGLELEGLVAPRSETAPCGDNIFVRGDGRFVRIVMVDSPGVGSGGEATRRIGARLQEIELVWPPDQVLEFLRPLLAAETAILVLGLDLLQQAVNCCGIGNISAWLRIDDRMVRPRLRPSVPGNGWHRVRNTLWRPERSMACILHTDGLRPMTPEEAGGILAALVFCPTSRDQHQPALPFLPQLAFASEYRRQDDAALCMGVWQP